MRAGRALVVAAAIALAAGPAAQAQRELRGRQVIASVTDRDGHPVKDLAVADFAVREDDAAREVLKVEPATGPMSIVLLLDTSASTQPLVQDLRAGATAFVRQMLAANTGAQIALWEFGDRPMSLVTFSKTGAQLEGAIGRLFSRPGSGACLLDAILEVSPLLKKQEAARRVIVAFTSLQSPEFSNATDVRVRDALKAASAALWTIVLEGPAGQSTRQEERYRAIVLGDIAEQSGGTREIALVQSAIEMKFKGLADRLASQYLVTYARPDSLVPPDKLEVRVTRQGLHVWATAWAGQ